jgi:DNA polymerase elongation subunit (family B)
MSIEQIVAKFTQKPYAVDMGARKLAGWWKTDVDNIRSAKRVFRAKMKAQKRGAKILIFDIETAPLKAWVYQKSVWKANIGSDKVISEWFMLTWSAKWLFEKKVMSDRLTSKEAINEDDKRIVKSLWKLLDEADIVIAHNGDNFDVPNLNTRFLLNDIPPPRLYQQIDTLRVAKKQFGFTHNNLDGLAKLFGFAPKEEVHFDLWVACREGEKRALMRMEDYNKRDVTLLEEVYLKLRPWIKGHPNLNLLIDDEDPRCPVCLSEDIHIDNNNYYMTGVSKFPVATCRSCGNSGRTRQSLVSKEKRKNMYVSIAR